MKLNCLVLAVFILSVVRADSGSLQCGIKEGIRSSIAGGLRSQKGEWPWLVAFVNHKLNKFFCAGNLISQKHVLSGEVVNCLQKFYVLSDYFVFLAAHCFQNKLSAMIEIESVTALMGKFNLDIDDEYGTQNSSLRQIILHPGWNIKEEKFDNDIAIALLNYPVEFDQYVKAVCLPQSDFHEASGIGTIVGWGEAPPLSTTHYESTPSQLLMPIINSSYCYTEFLDIARCASVRNFCGGYKNQGMAACFGDSGGGFYVPSPDKKFHVVRGIISVTLIDPLYGCDTNAYSLFINVARFIDWITKVFEATKDDVMISVAFSCMRSLPSHAVCSISNDVIIQSGKRYTIHFESTDELKHSHDVQKLHIRFGDSSSIFSGIGRVFPRLKRLFLTLGSIKTIDRIDFELLDNLEVLDISENPIQIILEDVFWDLTNVLALNMGSCLIEQLPKRVFSKLKKLKILWLTKNKLTFLDKDLFISNPNIERINLAYNLLKRIDVDFRKLTKIEALYLNSNDCIDLEFSDKYPTGLLFFSYSLEEVQNKVTDKCHTNNQKKKFIFFK